MTGSSFIGSTDFKTACSVGRPPNIVALFPNSNAMIISGKFIDQAILKKGNAIAMSATARNYYVILWALMTAQWANAGIIIEIARSEGGATAYCAINYWNIARTVDAFYNELGITILVAIYADHYRVKGAADITFAKSEIPSMFDSDITSIALDASNFSNDQNLSANIELNPYATKRAFIEAVEKEVKGSPL